MQKLQILLNIFKENRPVFFETLGQTDKPKTLGEVQTMQEGSDEKAAQITAAYFEKFGAFKDKPEETLDKDITINTDKEDNKGLGHYQAIQDGLETEIGSKIFPTNKVLAREAVLQLNQNYLNQTQGNQKILADLEAGNVKNVKFEKPVKNGNDITFKTTLLRADGKALHTIEVKFTKESLDAIETQREKVLQETKDSLNKQAEDIMEEIESDITLTDIQSKIKLPVKYAKTGETETHTEHKFTTVDGKDLGISVKINKKSYKQFIIEETQTENETKFVTPEMTKDQINGQIVELFKSKIEGLKKSEETEARARAEAEAAAREKAEAAKKPAEKEKTPFEKAMEEAGVTIGKDSKTGKEKVYFWVEGIERSFLLRKDFKQKLEKQTDANAIKLMCYEKLLGIVGKGIDIKKHRVAGGNKDMFERSNMSMREYVQAKGKPTVKPEEDKNYEKIGTFDGVEMYVNIRGEVVAKDGTAITEKTFTVDDMTSMEKIRESEGYKKAIETLLQRQKALEEGRVYVGVAEDKTPIYVDGSGKLYKPDNTLYEGVVAGASDFDLQRASDQAREKDENKKVESAKDAKERVEAIIQRDLAIVQQIANEITERNRLRGLSEDKKITTQDIRIDKAGKETRLSGGGFSREFEIAINGEKTEYKLSTTYSNQTKFEPEFAIQKAGERLQYEKVGNKTYFDQKFGKILEEYPNKTALKDVQKAIETLKQRGVEIKDPQKVESLTVQEFKTVDQLNDIIFDTIIDTNSNFFEIRDKINTECKKISKALEGSKLAKIEIKIADETFTWDKTKEEVITNDDWSKIAKLQELKLSPEEYESYIERSRKSNIDERAKTQLETRKAQYSEKYKELTTKPLSVDYRISEMRKKDIEKNWHHYSGTAGAVEFHMSQPPFGYTVDQVPHKVADMVRNLGVSNGVVLGNITFNEIFDAVDKSTLKIATMAKGAESGIPVDALKNAKAFMKEFQRLLDKGDKVTAVEAQRKEYMFNAVIVPCLDLKMAIARLRYDKDAEAKKEKAKERELSADQKEILEGLSSLCSWEGRKFDSKAAKDWEKFLSLFTKSKDKITMSNIDGSTFTLDKGVFQRYFDPKAAVAILVNREGLYDKDAEGNVNLIKDKIIDELNRIITKGVIQIMIAEKNKELEGNLDRREISKLIGSPKYNQRLAEAKITNLKGPFTEAQFKAFQLGFIIDQESKFDAQIKEGVDSFQEANPARAEILRQLVEQGLPINQVKAVQEQLVKLGLGVAFDKSGNFIGLGGGVGIDLGDGYTLNIGVGAGKGTVAVGAALNIEIFKAGKVTASTSLGISTAGIGANLGVTIEAGEKLDVSVFAGAGISWGGLPGGQIGFSLNWNAARDFESRLNSAEAKYFSPKVLSALDELKQIGDLSEEDVENLKKQLRGQIKEETLKDFKSPVITGGGIQLVMVGSIPVPIISLSICIGSVTVSTPNRKAISKQLAGLSGTRAEAMISSALKVLETAKSKPRYVEGLDRITYSTDGKIMVLDDKQEVEVNFDGITSSIDDYNEALDETDTKLIVHPKVNGKDRIELRVDNTSRKDVHINVDPLLKNLTVVQNSDDGKIFLVGNIDDLIITRERFTLPFESTEDGATIRDYITIKQKESVQGGRDNRWIEANAPYELVKLMEHARFYRKAGVNTALAGSNILEVAGFLTENPTYLSDADKRVIENYLNKQPDLSGRLDQAGVDQKATLVKGMKDVLDTRGQRMLKKDYDIPIPEGFLTKTEAILGNAKFMAEVAKIMGDGGNIIDLLKKPENKKMLEDAGLKDNLDVFKKGNEKLLNILILEIEDQSFSTFYKGAKEAKLTPKQMEQINKNLTASLIRRRDFIRDKVFLPKFESAYEKVQPKPGKSAQELCVKLFDDMFSDLLNKLKDPNFDFRKMGMELIPDGAEFFSGSKRMEKGKQVGAMATTLNYSDEFHFTDLVHNFGFLEGTMKDYMNEAKTDEEKAIARILMEIVNPTPNLESDKEFLESKFTQRMLSLDALVLIMTNENYQKLTEVVKDISKLKDPEYKSAFEIFKNLVMELHNAFTSRTPFERKIPGTLATLKVDFSETKLVAGSYTKCANPSLYLDMKARIGIYKEDRLVAEMIQTDEVVDADVSKQFISLNLGAGVAVTSTAKPKSNDGKYSKDGPGEKPAVAENVPETVTGGSGEEYHIENNPGSAGLSPSGH